MILLEDVPSRCTVMLSARLLVIEPDNPSLFRSLFTKFMTSASLEVNNPLIFSILFLLEFSMSNAIAFSPPIVRLSIVTLILSTRPIAFLLALFRIKPCASSFLARADIEPISPIVF